MKSVKTIVQQLNADVSIRLFLVECASAWDMQVELSEITGTAPENLNCCHSALDRESVIAKIEEILDLGSLRKMGNDFYSELLYYTYIADQDQDLEVSWKENIVDWLERVHSMEV